MRERHRRNLHCDEGAGHQARRRGHYDCTELDFDVRNDRASLKYDPEELESYRDYADSGGGSWTLKVLQNNIPKSYKSSEHLRHKELDLEDDSPGFIINNIGFIIEKMKNIFDILNE